MDKKGFIEPDYQERGTHDYRKDACLTMEQFEKVVLNCILYYNGKRIIENSPYTDDMDCSMGREQQALIPVCDKQNEQYG